MSDVSVSPPEEAQTDSSQEFFAMSGPLPTAWDEARRFPRFYYRSCVWATVYPPGNAPGQQPTQCYLLTSDLSRGGMNLLHNALLFPGQRLDVMLPNNVKRSLEILWCKRDGDRCYSAGARFIREEDLPPEPV